MAVWATERFYGFSGTVDASVRGARGGWQAPVTIAAGESYGPSVAMGSNGHAIAAWVTDGPTEDSIRGPASFEFVETATYEPPPP